MFEIERKLLNPYPNYGYFYKLGEMDYSLPLDQRETKDVLVYESECDIQEVSKAANPVLIATFSVFFPFDITKECPIRRGMKFQGSMNGIDISGMITNVVVSQVGGIVCYCKDYDSNER